MLGTMKTHLMALFTSENTDNTTMITLLTLITGLLFFTALITHQELKRLKRQINRAVNDLCRQPMQKPVITGTFRRVSWVKSAPLHLVIQK